jgi:hypothetical protein
LVEVSCAAENVIEPVSSIPAVKIRPRLWKLCRIVQTKQIFGQIGGFLESARTPPQEELPGRFSISAHALKAGRLWPMNVPIVSTGDFKAAPGCATRSGAKSASHGRRVYGGGFASREFAPPNSGVSHHPNVENASHHRTRQPCAVLVLETQSGDCHHLRAAGTYTPSGYRHLLYGRLVTRYRAARFAARIDSSGWELSKS